MGSSSRENEGASTSPFEHGAITALPPCSGSVHYLRAHTQAVTWIFTQSGPCWSADHKSTCSSMLGSNKLSIRPSSAQAQADGIPRKRRRKVRHICDGGLRRRIIYLLALASPTAMPITGTADRPSFPGRIFPVQNKQKPLRCQPVTIAGLIMTELGCQSPPDRRQSGPREPISGRQFRSFHRPSQNAELTTKSHNLKLKSRAIANESHESRRQRNPQRSPEKRP